MAALPVVVLAGLTAAGTATSFAAQRKQARATEQQGEYEAQLLEQNAGLAELQAADAVSRGQADALTRRGQTRQVVGAQRVGLAAQGIDIDVGSAADVQAEASAIGAFDALTIRNNAAREAWGYGIAAADARNRASLTRRGAKNLAGAQRTAAVGTLLTGGASFAGQYRAWSAGRGSPTRKPVSGAAYEAPGYGVGRTAKGRGGGYSW